MAIFVIGILERDYDSAFDAFERAFGAQSFVSWAGDYATAVQQAEQSLRLSTFGSLLAMRYVGLADAHFYAGRCEQALLATNRAPQVNQQFSVPWVLRTTNLGRNEELRASVQRLLELRPASRRTSGDAGKLCAGPEYRTSDADGVQ